ncbi:MAG: 3-methyl-2-oxobutanoate hydroxymethyltransferase [Chitinispirillaceae bacterium]|nr:3-methyl-2-oxobutanoate hydroxymethyltransferase [Chitinispirillaceae bacterium]
MNTERKMAKDCNFLLEKKKKQIPITMITAYDYPSAKIAQNVGIDVILVGDSVGTNVLGYKSEREVTISDMEHHIKAVARGASQTFIIGDLPYNTFTTDEIALDNSKRLLNAGADAVKIEGWEEIEKIVSFLSSKDVKVCGHIGYNPQIHGPKAKVFGKESEVAIKLIRSAIALRDAGAFMIVVEMIPEEICKIISEKVNIPIIGIGSGRFCDGQVLVFHDVVGLSEKRFKHAKAFGDVGRLIEKALSTYKSEVMEKKFPSEENIFHCPKMVIDEINKNYEINKG